MMPQSLNTAGGAPDPMQAFIDMLLKRIAFMNAPGQVPGQSSVPSFEGLFGSSGSPGGTVPPDSTSIPEAMR
jgi:hypothetical protein